MLTPSFLLIAPLLAAAPLAQAPAPQDDATPASDSPAADSPSEDESQATAEPAQAAGKVFALVGATVHTMVAGAEPAPQTVLVRDGVIEGLLAPDVLLPAGTEKIDVTGKHVVPGLIDGMVFFDPDQDALYVSSGVTTIRDLGGEPVRALIEREPAQRDKTPGPFLVTPGAVVDGDPPSSSEAAILRSPEMADQLLPILFNEKIDFLSTQLGLSPDAFKRAAELAHERGLKVWGPVPRTLTLEQALERGLDGVLFLDRLLPEGVGWDKVLPGGLKNGVQTLAAKSTPLVPVLRATELRLGRQDQSTVDFGLMDPIYEGQWMAERGFRETVADEEFVKTGERVMAKQLALLIALDEAGVPLLPGSAAPQPWLYPGLALHEELELWQRAGLAPSDVLARATREAAEIIGIDATRGTVARGKVADLLVLSDDPSLGVEALRAPEAVVLRGQVLDRERLDTMLAKVRAKFDARREELARPIEVPEPDVPEGIVVLRGKVDFYTVGERIRAERFAVVREPDGAVTYVGRTRYVASAEAAAREMRVLQRTRDGKLDEFVVELQNGTDKIVSSGLWTAEALRIERRANGAIVDTKNVRARVVCVDIGSVTSALLLTQLVRTEPFEIMTFHELLEPERATWAMGWGGEGGLVHMVRTHTGALQWQSTKLGSPELMRITVGGGIVESILVEEDARGGPGLPAPAEKLKMVKPAPPTDVVGPPVDGGGEAGDEAGPDDEPSDG